MKGGPGLRHLWKGGAAPSACGLTPRRIFGKMKGAGMKGPVRP